jgi:hypothetical protein
LLLLEKILTKKKMKKTEKRRQRRSFTEGVVLSTTTIARFAHKNYFPRKKEKAKQREREREGEREREREREKEEAEKFGEARKHVKQLLGKTARIPEFRPTKKKEK